MKKLLNVSRCIYLHNMLYEMTLPVKQLLKRAVLCLVRIKDSSYDQYDQTKPAYWATNPCLYSSLPRDSSNVIGCMHCPRTIHAYFSVSDSCDVISHTHQTPP